MDSGFVLWYRCIIAVELQGAEAFCFDASLVVVLLHRRGLHGL
jgi:hypothetical protein